MTRIDKLKRKLKDNPASLAYSDIETVLTRLGFAKKQGKGSHVKFSHAELEIVFIIPVHQGDCKAVYKRAVSKGLQANELI